VQFIEGGMGIRNYLIEGVSGAGKTAVASELQRRGYHVVHGDREIAYRGDPETGAPLDGALHQHQLSDPAFMHGHHLWHVDKVRSITSDRSHPVSFFCGGSRNFHQFIDLFDGVFVLDIDQDTLKARLASRPDEEFGGRPEERDLILRLHATKEDMPGNADVVDATAPLGVVVDDILARCGVD
jgi:adenylate kinase family enzyme